MLNQISTTAQLLLNETLSIIWGPYPHDEIKEQLAEVFSRYVIKPAPVPHGHPDLKQKIELFLAGKKIEGLSETTTLKNYQIELKIFAKHINKATAEITTNDIRDYLSRFPHLKQSSIAGKISVLKSFFGWLRMEEVIDKDPMLRIKHPKKEKRLPKSLSVAHFEMLREFCKTRRERAIVEMFYSTGCRLSELRNLNITDINWQTGTVSVIGKGNKERIAYISEKADYHLQKYLDSRDDDCEALFITERKPYRRLSTRGFQREIKTIAKRSGIPKNVYPHIIRHTFATDLLANGADLASVQGLLGHSNPSTTQIYAQVTNERMRQIFKQCHGQ